MHITEEQFAWFERTLQRYATWNVFVFSHAPILGCGLKALQKVAREGGVLKEFWQQDSGFFLSFPFSRLAITFISSV